MIPRARSCVAVCCASVSEARRCRVARAERSDGGRPRQRRIPTPDEHDLARRAALHDPRRQLCVGPEDLQRSHRNGELRGRGRRHDVRAVVVEQHPPARSVGDQHRDVVAGERMIGKQRSKRGASAQPSQDRPAAESDAGDSSGAAGEAVRCQSAGTAGGADCSQRRRTPTLDVGALGVTGPSASQRRPLPTSRRCVRRSSLRTSMRTGQHRRPRPPRRPTTTTSAMRSMRCLRPPVICATLTNDGLSGWQS